jgi:enamine deaminase RidA (YjgF/YER057c/UK114 family)
MSRKETELKPITPNHYPWKDYRRYTYPLGLDLGGLAFLSGNTASSYDKATDKIVCAGDLKAQAATAIEKIRVVLEAAGYAPEDVVSVIQYMPSGAFAERSIVEELLRKIGMGQARRHVVPVTRLLRRDALVELEVVAARPCERSLQGSAMRIMSGRDALSVFGEAHGGLAEGSLEASLENEVAAVSDLLDKASCDWSQVMRCHLLLATDQPAELDRAARHVVGLVPQLSNIPAIGVAALPTALGKARISLAIAGQLGAQSWPSASGSLVRRAGRFFIATGLRAATGEGITQQAEQIYCDMVPRLLESAGIALDGIVQTVEWLTLDALPEYKNTGPVRRNALREPFPVSSGLVCSALPGGAKLSVDLLATER